jgi:hypothetical protein
MSHIHCVGQVVFVLQLVASTGGPLRRQKFSIIQTLLSVV